MRSRTATALVGLVLSLLISVIGWWYFNTLLFFVIVPFIPLLFRRGGDGDRQPVNVCPRCGFRTRDPDFEYCPRDGTTLESE